MNVVRLLIGGLVALFALVATLLAAIVVALATVFGLLARALGIQPTPRSRPTPAASPRRRPPAGTGDVIDVETTEVTSSSLPPKS